MHIITAQQIEHALPLQEIISAVKAGILSYQKEEYIVPTRMHLEQPGLDYLLMPAIGQDYLCTKLVAVVPANKQREMPVINGTLVLHRRDTGVAVAMMDASMITSLRTGAVGAIGLELMITQAPSSIGVIGCGVQGIWQSIFAATAIPIDHIFCYSRTPERFEVYRSKVKAYYPNLGIVWCESADEVVERAELIYGCTTSPQPVFSNDKKLIEGKRFISVGSFRKNMQELPDEVYLQAEGIIIDSPAATEEVGDLINAIARGMIAKEQIVTIGEILSGKRTLKNPQDWVFKSVGMAAFDLALAEAIYRSL